MKKTLLHPLDDLGFLLVRGTDADAFLQGQLSNDIHLLSATQGQITSYNSPKGRMLAVLHLARTPTGILMQTEHNLIEGLLQRLRLFVLRAAVVLEDASAAIGALGLSGEGAGDVLKKIGLSAPEMPLACTQHGDWTVMRRLGALPRYAVHGPALSLPLLQERLVPLTEAAARDEWRRLDILAGVPTVLPQTRDRFVPQMANLDALGGISFNKGCYTGQEIVARMHYLGQLKRRLFHATAAAAATAEPGMPVYDEGHDQAVGEVAQVAVTDAGLWLGIVLQLTHATSDRLHLGSPTGRLLSRPQKPACLLQQPAPAPPA